MHTPADEVYSSSVEGGSVLAFPGRLTPNKKLATRYGGAGGCITDASRAGLTYHFGQA